MADREMTLDEYVGVLPEGHLAARELRALQTKVMVLERENELLCEELARSDATDGGLK